MSSLAEESRRNSRRLLFVRTLHTVIYVGLAACIVLILISGSLGLDSPYLLVALGLVGIEVIVFVSSGLRCPLTTLARKYGAAKGHAFDTFLPESIAKNTLSIFGILLAVGLVLLALRTTRLL